MIIIMILLQDYKKCEQDTRMPGEIFTLPGNFLRPVNSVHFRHGSTGFLIFLCDYILPRHTSILPHGCSLRTTGLLVLLKNFLRSVLLCFLGVALLKIVYKKANQQASFYFSSNISPFSVQSNDTVLHKSRAIAGQRGLSLLHQQ